MSEQAAAALETETRRVLELLDAMDLSGLAAMLTEDAQSVDEISRTWTRGRAALDDYFAQLEGTVADVRSRLSDVHATSWGDAGLVTFVLHQTYKMNGQEQELSAPTSMVFRRLDDGWKVAMDHEEVEIVVRVADVGTSSVRLEHEVRLPDGSLAASGKTVLVAWDPARRGKRALTEAELAALS